MIELHHCAENSFGTRYMHRTLQGQKGPVLGRWGAICEREKYSAAHPGLFTKRLTKKHSLGTTLKSE